MLHVTVLRSGSSGNCSLVEFGETRILVDAGLSAKRIAELLAEVGVEPSALTGILVTHEHDDHASGLGVWSARHGTPVYANVLTAEAIRYQTKRDVRIPFRMFQTGSPFELGGVEVRSFSIPHDAAEPVGFVLSGGGSAVGFLTDLGYATGLVRQRARDVDTLVIESNHDERLLLNDVKRPWSVRQRISSRHGHLSNDAASEVLAELAGGRLRRAVLGHLSRDLNTPEIALRTARERLGRESGGDRIELMCAGADCRTDRMQVA
jgi:phosphoribosyl 1,2-cyclic phosphodiesterase